MTTKQLTEGTPETAHAAPSPAPMDRDALVLIADGNPAELIEIRNVDLVALCKNAPAQRLYASAAQSFANRPPEHCQKIARSTLRELLGLGGLRTAF